MKNIAYEIDPLLCRTVVEQSLDHLFKLIRNDGKFIYAHRAGDIFDQKEGYNLLRHCGTVWFMCMAIGGLSIDLPKQRLVVLRSVLEYIVNKMQQPTWLDMKLPCLALVSTGNAKLGGVGLAMIMLSEFEKIMVTRGLSAEVGGKPVFQIIKELERYSLAQIDENDFVHKRNFETGSVDPFRSEYYTGEALFGLMKGQCKSAKLRQVFEGLMMRGYGVDVQSHWMAYAACDAAKQRLVHSWTVQYYIESLITAILQDTSYRDRSRSTPIACRSEALATFLTLANHTPSPAVLRYSALLFPKHLVTEARSALEKNLQLQLRWYADGQFWRGDDSRTVQIDYIQHNATSFLLWYLLYGDVGDTEHAAVLLPKAFPS